MRHKNKDINNMNVHYSAKDVTALTPREHLIKRINLTFSGETGCEEHPYSSQKSIAVRELQDNAVSELLRGFGDRMRVTFYKDGSVEVLDNGRGLPIDTTKNAFGQTVSGVIITMGTLQSGENLGENSSDGKGTNQNGLGASSTVALSSKFHVTVYRDGYQYSLSFKDGIPGFFDEKDNFTELEDLTYLKKEKDNRPSEEKKLFPKGTKVRTWLNKDVFSSPYPVDSKDLIERLKGTSYLIPGITIEVVNELDEEKPKQEFYSHNGISDLVDLMTTDTLSNIISIKTSGDYVKERVPVVDKETGKIKHKNVPRTVDIEVAFNYSNNYDYQIESYVNTIRTQNHGVHVQAFEKALLKVFNNKFSSMRGMLTAKDPVPTIEDYREGLTVIVSCYISEPDYKGQTKDELSGSEVQKAIFNSCVDFFEKWVSNPKNNNDLKIIGEKVTLAAKNRQKARDIQELKREKARLEKTSDMPVKLVDCELNYDDKSELFIVEGDSALGAMKGARDSFFQALLPIRGKLINMLKTPMKECIANSEVSDIIKCLDSGVGEDFKISEARYRRVFIATDADVDGNNIACLLLVAFWRLFPDLVKKGRLYKVCTPLFIIREGKNTQHYCYNNDEFDQKMKELKGKKFTVVRAKGLGETGADVLSETGMNPETRRLERIVIEDIEKAERWLEIAMGPDVAPRKEWIESNQIQLERIGD